MNHYFQIQPGSILARVVVLLLLGFQAHLSAAETFRVASYNLQNYFLSPGNRPVKSPE
jgi:hypothetical protein